MVEVHRSGAVARVELNRPEALNAISTALAAQLAARLRELGAEPGLRALVLASSGGRAFCAGADLKERNGFSDAELHAQRPVMRELFGAVLELPMPAVAAVGGYALGGGFELALCCDLIAADANAVFGLPEVTVGLVPGGGGTQLLSRRIGLARAADLLYTGRQVSYAEACELGIVDRTAKNGASALDTALELAAAIADNSPVGVRHAKRALRGGYGLALAAALDVEDAAWRAAAFSADRVEGISAFADKRRPEFR
jgi:enoyl-CoA hydratase/carnithine racemase